MDQLLSLKDTPMNILITGITGLFGSFLAKEFGQLGKVYGLKRAESKFDLLENAGDITWHEGDLSDLDSLLEALKGKDLVVHAAGLVSFSSKDQETLLHTNTLGTTHLVDAMLASEVKKLVHVSSVAAIGRSAEIHVIDENYKWVDTPLNTAYAISKYRAELEVWRGEQEGLQVLVVNPSILLGKIEFQRSSTELLDYVMDENKFYPTGNVNYIDVRDAAEITRLLVEKEKWGERFILNRESIPYLQFFQEAAQSFDKKAPSISVSAGMGSVVAFFAGILRTFGMSQIRLTRQTAQLSQQKIFFENKKINTLLDFPYRSLKETLDWAKSPK